MLEREHHDEDSGSADVTPPRTEITWAAVANEATRPLNNDNKDSPDQVEVVAGAIAQSPPARKVIELCAGKKSRFCDAKWKDKGCAVKRFTKDEDLTLNCNVEDALKEVRFSDVMIVIAVPCVGGSQIQRLNNWRAGASKRMRQHQKVFNQIMNNVTIICREAKK